MRVRHSDWPAQIKPTNQSIERILVSITLTPTKNTGQRAFRDKPNPLKLRSPNQPAKHGAYGISST